MKMAVVVVAAVCLAPVVGHAQTAGWTIRVEPNVAVSHDMGEWYGEMWIAAHPTDPDRLLGMATAGVDGAGPTSGLRTETFSSADGGQSWSRVVHPQFAARGSGDPITGFGRNGTAYGVALIGAEHKLEMWMYRAVDGVTFADSVMAGSGDHERMAVDYSTGTHAGSVYLASEYMVTGVSREELLKPRPDQKQHRISQVGVWRSDDDGRTWVGPVVAGENTDGGLQVDGVNVLSDGTVAVYMNTYPGWVGNDTGVTYRHELALSSDGGVTFAPMRQIGTQYFGGDKPFGKFLPKREVGGGWGQDMAADISSAKFRNRMYCVYAQSEDSLYHGRVRFSYSADHGKTWSAPAVIGADSHPYASDFLPAIAVTNAGTVGVMWLSTRDFPNRDGWNAYFAASVDGGATFLPPVRLTTVPSAPLSAGNLRPVAGWIAHDRHEVSIRLASGFSSFPEGGDYLGLAADANGVFHPLWDDVRYGVAQLMTTRVTVAMDRAVDVTRDSGLVQRSINERILFSADPSDVDVKAQEVALPLRLKNVSSDTLFPPFRVDVKGLGIEGAELMNATGGGRGKGAWMDYSHVLRDLSALPPGGVTDAVVWRVHLARMNDTNLFIEAGITGGVRDPELAGRHADSVEVR
jgi:hypothetical protein